MGLTDDQKRNLINEGYDIKESGGKTFVSKETPTGLVRYNLDSDGKLSRIDNYFGNVRDSDDHDRLSVDKDGRMSGHGFDHKDKF